MANWVYNRLIIYGKQEDVDGFVAAFGKDLFRAHVPIPEADWKQSWGKAMEGHDVNASSEFAAWMKDNWGVSARLLETRESVAEIPEPEVELSWFTKRFGGFPEAASFGAKVVVLKFETAWLPPCAWAESVINGLDGQLSIAMYSLNPNSCFTTISQRGNAQVACLPLNGIAVTQAGDTSDGTNILYQTMLRHFGFVSEQFGWQPDFFFPRINNPEVLAMVDETEMREEHDWVLRGSDKGDGYPQYFNVINACFPANWITRACRPDFPVLEKDDCVLHKISSFGLCEPELEELHEAQTSSAVYRMKHDPFLQPLLETLIEDAVRSGAIEAFESTQRGLHVGGGSADLSFLFDVPAVAALPPANPEEHMTQPDTSRRGLADISFLFSDEGEMK